MALALFFNAHSGEMFRGRLLQFRLGLALGVTRRDKEHVCVYRRILIVNSSLSLVSSSSSTEMEVRKTERLGD